MRLIENRSEYLQYRLLDSYLVMAKALGSPAVANLDTKSALELCGMDSTLPQLKDSGERLLDAQWTRVASVGADT